MDIAVIHPAFTGGRGGAKQVSFEIADTLSEEHEVTHFTEHSFSKKEATELFDLKNYQKVQMKEVKKPKYLKILESTIFPKTDRFLVLKKALSQKKFIKLYHKEIKESFDLVFFTGGLFDYSKYYLSEEEFNEENQNTIVYRHRGPNRNARIEDKHPLYKIMFAGLSEIKDFNPETNIFNSEYSRQEGTKDGKVIYPPIKDRFNYSEGGNYIICLDRISREKRLEDSITISRESEIDLKIVGRIEDETYLKELRQKTGENTEILTEVSDEELVELLKGAKYGLNCGKDTEGFGITTVEYMKSGVIPVVRDSAANKEVVEKESLRWNKKGEAIDIIKRLERNSASAHDYIRERKEDFSREKFRKEMIKFVDELK